VLFRSGVDIGAAEAPQEEPLPAEGSEAPSGDDISRISGIGATLKKKLAAEGVSTVSQIAEWTSEQVASLDDKLKLKGRIGREEWVEQAKELLAGKPPRARADRASA